MSKQLAIDLVDQVFTLAKKKGLLQLNTQEEQFDGRLIQVNQKAMINFGSCSYLGLERDPRLINACIETTKKFGTQFSSSRAYLSSPQYEELESLLSQLYSAPTLVSATTSLGHISALPAITRPNDLIILDHQVHASVQTACKLLKAQNERIEMIRHNDLNHLETLIKEHRSWTNKIWYCTDGVHSMYGELAPIDALYQLMDQYPEFHLYVDDAHGMSWCGKNGKGSVRGSREHHPQLVLSVSLNKAFGCAGGLHVLPNAEMRRRISTCGGSLIFSGPIQPPLLGAAVASAKIHLSGEVEELQNKLQEKITYCRDLIQKYHLPDVANSEAPVFYIGTSELNAGFNLVQKLHHDGFYVNIGMFPAVPLSNSGLRFTITNHLTFDDIKNLVEKIAHYYPIALSEESVTSEEVADAFHFSPKQREDLITQYPLNLQTGLHFQITDSITTLEKEWGNIPIFFGMTGVKNFKLLEEVFGTDDPKKIDPNHWLFQYVTVRDKNEKIILLTVLTVCDIKTDMFAKPKLSDLANEYRKNNPEAFISKCVMMGTPVTVGTHLYLDESHTQHKEALGLLLKHCRYTQHKYRADILSLRDFPRNSWIVQHLAQKGYLIQLLPDTHHLDRVSDFGTPQYIADLNKRHRQHWKTAILPYIPLYTIHEVNNLNGEELACFYNMYLKVQERSKEVSTFPLPITLFQKAVNTGTWRCYGLKHQNQWAACMFIITDKDTLTFLINATNPSFKNKGIYRVCLYHVNKIAQKLSLKHVFHGLTAGLEKRRIGATATPIVALIRITNNYQFEALESLSTKKT